MRRIKICRRKKQQIRRNKKAMRRRSRSYLLRRRRRLENRRRGIILQREFDNRPFIRMSAPSNFSFIDNTNEVLSYLILCKDKLKSHKKIEFDLSLVTNISSDAIALLAACANDKIFLGERGKIKGNAPKDKDCLRGFIESGFYNHVNCRRIMKAAQRKDKSIFHKESHLHVQSDVAKKACLLGADHVFGSKAPISDLYEMLVEAMSNTNNHANCNDQSQQVKWWLYTYNDPRGCTVYTFIDLGVGIFDSRPVQAFKKIKKLVRWEHNADLVEDLLSGRIKSRESIDNEIRGKGIPQMAENSRNNSISKAYIVSNDVKINLKTWSAEKLSNNFFGTLLYWELTNNLI